MNILTAIADRNLFRPFLGQTLGTWQNWFAALAILYGLRCPQPQRQVVRQCTGRKCRPMPKAGFDTALFLTGRRSGKSRVAALIGAYEAALAGHEKKLAAGEKGVVAVCAPTKYQGRIVRDYLRAIFDPPLLRDEIAAETREGFELRNGVRIEMLAGDWRTIRGYTLIAAIVDELAFFGLDEESKVRSDTELVRAIKPSLATVGGKLVCISTPYAKKGFCHSTWKKNFANDAGKALVWNCPSRTMNPTLPQEVVDAALEEDLQAARSEYLGEFRDDVAEFLPRSLIEGLVVPGRTELLPQPRTAYQAFVDLSGGRHDDAALAIAHRNDGRKVVLDLLRRYRPPHNPHEVITSMVQVLRLYGLRRVTGDNYAAEFVARAFQGQGIGFSKCKNPKSVLYLELLPVLCSGEVELLDHEAMVTQLAGLERRTRSGGRDIVDHPAGAHDDLANVTAGVTNLHCKRRITVGAWRPTEH